MKFKSKMHSLRFLSIFLALCFAFKLSFSSPGPYVMRISCGARENVHTKPTNTLWYKDFAYTGGIPTNGSRPTFISPPLTTLRYFPSSEGPENCYNIKRVPHGHYSVRIYFGLVEDPSFDNEPLFDVSVEGTLIYTLPSGWSIHDDEGAFVEALVFLEDGTASLCFHSTGHGDPAILAIEILQVDNRAYYFGTGYGQGTILRTHKRLSCGTKDSKFDVDYNGDRWGGDRFWTSIHTFGQGSDNSISTQKSIKQASIRPNVYPEALYKSAIVSTDEQPDLTYSVDVEPNQNYSIWLHFAEIDSSITGEGQRVLDILINGDVVFPGVDIVKMAGGINSALVLNKTVAVNGRTLTITLHPTKGTSAIINAIEIFEVLVAESKTVPEEVKALQTLKGALGLPLRIGWNGDPCVPQQHPWSGTDCLYDKTSNKWVIDGLDLDNQGLRGFLPNEISHLRHLQSINLSGNSIKGPIPSALGLVTTLEKLDLSYNFFNGSIPESLGQLTSLRILNLNGNSLSGRVPVALGGRLLHRASFNFTDNAGLCGIPGLRTCGPHLSVGAKVGIGFGVLVALLLIATCLTCWWKRRQNILRAQRIAARDAPYAKARAKTHLLSLLNLHFLAMERVATLSSSVSALGFSSSAGTTQRKKTFATSNLRSNFIGDASGIRFSNLTIGRNRFVRKTVECKESRIGKQPIPVPSNVTINMEGQDFKVKGPLGELAITYPREVKLEKEESGVLRVRKAVETRRANEMHGLFRTLTDNMIVGVSKGFDKKLQLVGVGYRATVEGKDIVLNLGFSHPVRMAIPDGLQVKVEENTRITVSGYDKSAIGQFAASIRKWRPPEPYKGKGVKYADEVIRRKEGKAGKKK